MILQPNGLNRNFANPNCFEKTKVRWGIFKKLSPTKLHSEQSAPLAANGWGLMKARLKALHFSLPQTIVR